MILYFIVDLMYFVLMNGGWLERPFFQYIVVWMWQGLISLPFHLHTYFTDHGLMKWGGRVFNVTSDAWFVAEVEAS